MLAKSTVRCKISFVLSIFLSRSYFVHSTNHSFSSAILSCGAVMFCMSKSLITADRLSTFNIREMPLSHGITQEKKDDVNKLLTNMFGEWQSLDDEYFQWYKQIIFSTPSVIDSQNEPLCDCLEAETAIHI